MTESELRAKYIQAYRIIKQERRMRERVFRDKPDMLPSKLVEMDMLLTLLTEFKDELKAHCEPGVEQMALIDPPVRYE
jgi:hypothetical protein